MKALLYKDFLVLRRYSVMLSIYFVLAALWCLIPAVIEDDLPSNGAVMSCTSILVTSLIVSMLPVSCLAADEGSGWMKQAMMGVPRRQYFLAKCLVHMLTGIASVLFSTGIVLGINIWYGEITEPYVLSTILFSALGALEANLYMGAVILPLTVKLGAEKGRFLWFFAGLPIAPVLFVLAGFDFWSLKRIVLPLLTLLLIPVAAVIIIVMLLLGLRWMERKEL